jgi:phosphoketolase
MFIDSLDSRRMTSQTETPACLSDDEVALIGDEPVNVHQQLAAALDEAFDDMAAIQRAARSGGDTGRPVWPVIVLRTPKGWTGPRTVDGQQVEGTWRLHRVPLAETHDNPGASGAAGGMACAPRRRHSTW